MTNQTTEALRERLDLINTYYTNHSPEKVFSVPVKHWKTGKDLDEIIADKKLDTAAAQVVREHFTEDVQNDLLYQWLDYSYQYFAEILKGYAHNADETPEPIKTIKALGIEYGRCGRSGGHFYIGSYNIADDMITDAEDSEDEEETAQLAQDATDYLDAIEWALEEAKTYCGNLSFDDELAYRIDEYLTDGIDSEIEHINGKITHMHEKLDLLKTVQTMQNVPY